FLIGLLSVLGVFYFVKIVLKNEWTGLIAAWCFNFSPSFFYHTVNPLPDNFALCCGIWSLVYFFRFKEKQNIYKLFLGSVFLSLAALTKLPFILFASVPFAYQIFYWKRLKKEKKLLSFSLTAYGLLILPLAWYAWVIPHWQGNDVAKGIFSNQASLTELFSILWGNIISTLPELLLNYAAVPFFAYGIFRFFQLKYYQKKIAKLFVFLLLSILAFFFYEINLIGTVHDYYLFPFFPLLFLLVGFGGLQLWKSTHQMSKAFVILALVVAPLTAHLRIADRWNLDEVGFNKDFLSYKTELQNAVPKDALCVIGNDVSGHILFYYTNKKGWRFERDILSADVLKYWITEGAEYLYSDSRQIENDPKLQPYLSQLIMEKGSVRVFQLQLP
ncbi:MAG: glycosyltransferase family 39 protein, partial [Bacteroidota bacterium]